MSKKQPNFNEEIFIKYLEEQNKSWIYEPKRFMLHNKKYIPDFYCPEDDVYYEVIGTRHAYYANKQKYEEFQEFYPELKFKIVNPDGSEFRLKRRKFRRGLGKTESVFVRVPIKEANQLKDIAEETCRTLNSLIRQAIQEFLNK